MPIFSCCTCSAQYSERDQPPSYCIICTDERQYVAAGGQHWTTRGELAEQGHANRATEVEPGVHSITAEPKIGIGQQALLVQNPHGNVLWDCLGFLHPDFPGTIAALGGVQAIAISHPHFYTACADWAEAFGCKVFLHEADRDWVTRHSPRLEFWSGNSRQLLPGVELIRLGGHFPGSCVMLWRDGCKGMGALFAGDTIFPAPDHNWVSFMYSFPNLVPLPAQQVARIGTTMQRYSFDRLYGAFPGAVVQHGAFQIVKVK